MPASPEQRAAAEPAESRASALRIALPPLPRRYVWPVSVSIAIFGAWLNHTLSAANNGRLTFMLLYPAVLIGGYLGGVGPAVAAALIGAAAVTLLHPEMTDGRTLAELGAVGLFLLIAAAVGAMFQRLHRLRATVADPLIPPPPERMTWRTWSAVALALIAGLTLSFSLNETLRDRMPFTFLYPVVALAGYLGGWRPAMAAGVIGASVVFAGHPALARGSMDAAIVSMLFLAIAALMGWLAETLHHATSSAREGAAALRELPAAQARFAAIAQTSPDALWIWDRNAGGLVFISRASVKLLGLEPAEACALSRAELWETINPEDQAVVEAACKALGTAATGQTIEYECRHRHRDASWRWLRNRTGVFTRNPDGSVAQIFGHTEDVTERHETSQRLAQQTAELERIANARESTIREREALLEAERAARAEAERANRLKDDFLATVSHELRTPLTAMLGWTAMLSEDAKDEELRSGLEVISRNARAQRQLIEDLLDMSRIMTGKLRIDPRPVLLGEVVAAAIETVRPAADARGVALTSQIEHCEEPIQADVDRLQQVIWNLLSNAVKFTPAGGQVRIVAACADREANISVIDTGQGMAPEFVPHVFERFRQADGTTTRKAGGLGLGLAIVKHLVELHGGTVGAQSEGLGKGAVFTVTLPLHSARAGSHFGRNPEIPVAGAAKPAASARETLAGRRLLIIDDEADTRSFLYRVLTEQGARVDVAGSAAEGLELALEEKPDAVICDISMPMEDGYSFIRNLRRAEDGGRALPAAALTALARTEDRDRALAAGFDAHCAKPVEPAELLALVGRLLPGG